jgi:hypothetical protein
MVRTWGAVAVRLDFEEPKEGTRRRRLRLASAAREVRGPEKYRLLDLERRRAQIRARRLLGLMS